MQITNINVRKLFNDNGSMKAIASITFDDQLALHDVKVIQTASKLFVVMPNKKNADGTFRDTVHPINAEFRCLIENAVIKAYNEALENAEKE